MSQLEQSFKENKFIKAPALVSKEICALLARYAIFKQNVKPKVRRGNDPLANIHREYNDPLMELFLGDLTKKVEEITGLELWPTLSFYYTYQKGNKLIPHKDRASCEIIVALKIGSDKEFEEKEKDWPLYFKDKNNQPVHIPLEAGDALILNGHEIEHWRDPFKGEWFVSAIFGYVEKQGKNAYQKFDQRKKLGLPHVGIGRWYTKVLWENLKQKFYK